MSRPCPYCGTDSEAESGRCPNCGFNLAGHDAEDERKEGSGQPGASGPAGAGWDKTVMEPMPPAADAARKARFDRTREFYEPVSDMPPAPRGMAMENDDRTVIERRVVETPDADATVIIRGGRHGYAGPLAYLVERSGIRAGKVHLLKTETNIGRGADNDVALSDESVSRHHAKIRLEDGKFTYWDLASANFSFLVAADGSRARILEPRQLADGDKIDLGDARVVFILVDAGESTDAS